MRIQTLSPWILRICLPLVAIGAVLSYLVTLWFPQVAAGRIWHGLALAALLTAFGLQCRQAKAEARRWNLISGEYHGFLEHLADWAIVLDTEGRVLHATEGVTRYGQEAAAMAGRLWTAVIPMADPAPVRDLLEHLRTAESNFATQALGEVQLTRGDRRHFEVFACRAFADGGLRYLFLFRDVTERHHLEDSMALADRQSAIAQLAAGIAHNFNNVLAGIMLNVGLLAEAEGDMRTRVIGRVLTSAERGADLCQKLLTFARGRAPSLGAIPVAPLLSDVVSLFGTEARRYGVALDWEAAPDLTVYGDGTQIQQVLLNLLFNAREAIGQNGQIWLQAERDGENVAIAVRNSGPPIPAAHLPLIFLPFFTTRTDRVQGTGMGLAVCQSLVQGMKGRIDVCSPPDGQTTFLIRLPAGPVPSTLPEEVGSNADSDRG